MSVSDWITIISIAFAVIAIYPASERIVITNKLMRFEIPALIFWLFLILYLIKFDDIADKIQFLHSFYFRWGLKANDWAMLFFLVLLFYSAWRLFYRIPQILPKQKLIDKGFNFKYITNQSLTKNNHTYFFCYEFGFLPLENDLILIVKKKVD